jgi:predicted amidohydrolase
MPNPAMQRLFDRAHELKAGFYVGYAEITSAGQRYNCSILVQPDGQVLGRYRKVQLPGSAEPRKRSPYNLGTVRLSASRHVRCVTMGSVNLGSAGLIEELQDLRRRQITRIDHGSESTDQRAC